MDAAIRGLAIGITLEPCLAYRAILGHEAWQVVCLFEILFEEIELRIEVRRTCAAGVRIAMTAGTAVEVHPGPQTVSFDFVTLLEFRNSGVEQVRLRTC